jgi:hypothetical protein
VCLFTGSAAAAMPPPPPHHLNAPFPHASLGHGLGVGGRRDELLSPATAGSSDYRHDSNALGPSPATALGAQRQTDAAGNTVGFIGNPCIRKRLGLAQSSHSRLTRLTQHALRRLLRLRLLSSHGAS